MRKKQEILDQFEAIQRHFLKKDIELPETVIQSIAVLTEVLVDIRSNLAVIVFEKTNKSEFLQKNSTDTDETIKRFSDT